MNYRIIISRDLEVGEAYITKTEAAANGVNIYGDFHAAKAAILSAWAAEMESLRADAAKLRGLREKHVATEGPTRAPAETARLAAKP